MSLAASRLWPWTSGAMGWAELATASKQKTLAEGNYPPKWIALIEDLVGVIALDVHTEI